MGSAPRCCRGPRRLAQGLRGAWPGSAGNPCPLTRLQIQVPSPGSYVALSRVGCGPCAAANPSGSDRGSVPSQVPSDLGNPLSSFTAAEGLLPSADLHSCAVIQREFKYEQAWELISQKRGFLTASPQVARISKTILSISAKKEKSWNSEEPI